MAKTKVEYEIVKRIAELSVSENGWSVQLNLISWNGNPAKYDIRAWNEDMTKMGSGKTLTQSELQALKDALNKMEV